jgi:catechol 2,3-dioxygenase-like lactoylglutathione lyase family enzyme
MSNTSLIENTIPVLPVASLSRSIKFYRDSLGFELDWGGGPESTICSVSRDGCPIMLQVREAAAATVWIGLIDDSLFETLLTSGIPVVQLPLTAPGRTI